MWKSRMVAISFGCLGCSAVQACQVSSEQVSVPGPQIFEQSRTTGATSQVPCNWLSWQSCVPAPQLLVQGNRAGGATHADHSLSVQVCTPVPQIVLQVWVAALVGQALIRKLVRSSQAAARTRQNKTKSPRSNGMILQGYAASPSTTSSDRGLRPIVTIEPIGQDHQYLVDSGAGWEKQAHDPAVAQVDLGGSHQPLAANSSDGPTRVLALLVGDRRAAGVHLSRGELR